MTAYRFKRPDLLDRDNLWAAITAARDKTGMLAHPTDIRDTVETYKAIYKWHTDLTYHASWRKIATYFGAKFMKCA